MNENEALSVLNSLDGEISALLAQRQAAKVIADVIASYQLARRGLDAIGRATADAQTALNLLQERYAADSARMRGEHQAALDSYQAEENTAREKAQLARDTLGQVESSLVAAERRYQERSAVIDSNIDALTVEYERLQTAFQQFKTEHGL